MEQKDLKAIKQQLQYALDELHNEKPDIDLLHDWISDPLQRVKNLTIPVMHRTTQVWNNISKIKPINKGLYYCYIPEGKGYHEHIGEYWFDGNDFRDGDTLFRGKFGGRKITEHITHWLIIEKPCVS